MPGCIANISENFGEDNSENAIAIGGTIGNHVIVKSNDVNTSLGTGDGIHVGSNMWNAGGNLSISDNSLNGNFSRGICLNTLSGGVISSNTINITPSIFDIGILSNANDANVVFNTIVGTYESEDAVTRQGIAINAATGNFVKCNNVRGLEGGIVFFEDCRDTDLRHNEMGSGDKSLLLHDELGFTMIGQQLNKGNMWPDAINSSFEAYIESFAVNPLTLAEFSQFQVANQMDPLWPEPIFPSTSSPPNGADWFIQFGNDPDPNVDHCPLASPNDNFTENTHAKQISEAERTLIEGTFPYDDNWTAYPWQMAFDLYKKLDFNAQLLAEGQEYQHFYDDFQTTSAYQLYLPYKQLLQLSSLYSQETSDLHHDLELLQQNLGQL